jgi:hypothetical protein
MELAPPSTVTTSVEKNTAPSLIPPMMPPPMMPPPMVPPPMMPPPMMSQNGMMMMHPMSNQPYMMAGQQTPPAHVTPLQQQPTQVATKTTQQQIAQPTPQQPPLPPTLPPMHQQNLPPQPPLQNNVYHNNRGIAYQNNQPSAPPMWSPPSSMQPNAMTPDATRSVDAILSSQEDLRKSWQALEEQQRYVQEQQMQLEQNVQRRQQSRNGWDSSNLGRSSSNLGRSSSNIGRSSSRSRYQNKQSKDTSYEFETAEPTEGTKTTASIRERVSIEAPTTSIPLASRLDTGKLDSANEELNRFSRMRKEMMND